MNIAEALEKRLRALSEIRYIGYTGDFAKAEAGGFVSQALPAVYIGMPSESAQPRESFHSTSRKTTVEFFVWLAALDVRSAATKSLGAPGAFEALRNSVMDVIEDWRHESMVKGVEFVRGDPYAASTTNGVVIYQDKYKFQYRKKING